MHLGMEERRKVKKGQRKVKESSKVLSYQQKKNATTIYWLSPSCMLSHVQQ